MRKLPAVSGVAISVIPSRRPEMKIHEKLGDAKKAVYVKEHSQRIRNPEVRWGWEYGPRVVPAARIYTIVDNDWHLLYDIEEDTLVDELPWKKE